MYAYCTSKNNGPESSSAPPTVLYLGTSLDDAEKSVTKEFRRYKKTSENFPTRFPEAHSALPKASTDWEMVEYYAADGWWISIVRFELTPTEEEEVAEEIVLRGDGKTVTVLGNSSPEPYPDEEAKNDMANVVAQFTSGVKGAIPEQEDFFLADRLLVMIALVLKKD